MVVNTPKLKLSPKPAIEDHLPYNNSSLRLLGGQAREAESREEKEYPLVLVVDDFEMNVELLSLMLQQLGVASD